MKSQLEIMPPDTFHHSRDLTGWWAVATKERIVAYFDSEEKAKKYVNGSLGITLSSPEEIKEMYNKIGIHDKSYGNCECTEKCKEIKKEVTEREK